MAHIKINPVKFILVASFLILAGCSNIPKYTEPSTSKQAKMRIIITNPEQYSSQLFTVNLSTCTLGAGLGWIDEQSQNGVLERRVPSGEKLVLQPVMVLPTFKWIYIFKAAKPMLDEVTAGPCNAPIFVPEEGAEYEYLITPAPGTCKVILNKLYQDDSGTLKRQEVITPQGQFIHPNIKDARSMICPQI